MPKEVTCAFCNERLQIADDAPAGSVTCPICLAEVANPVTPATNVARESTAPSCPRCGKPVEPAWNYCAACQAPMRLTHFAPRIRQVDGDVREDVQRTGLGIGCLGVIGLLAAIYCIIPLFGLAAEQQSFAPFLGLVITIAVIAGTVVVVRKARGKTVTVWRVVDRSFAVIGAMALIGLAIAGAFFIFLLAVCASGAMRF
jgi:hypothetical protein